MLLDELRWAFAQREPGAPNVRACTKADSVFWGIAAGSDCHRRGRPGHGAVVARRKRRMDARLRLGGGRLLGISAGRVWGGANLAGTEGKERIPEGGNAGDLDVVLGSGRNALVCRRGGPGIDAVRRTGNDLESGDFSGGRGDAGLGGGFGPADGLAVVAARTAVVGVRCR